MKQSPLLDKSTEYTYKSSGKISEMIEGNKTLIGSYSEDE